MAKIQFELNQEQVDKLILDDLVVSFRINENDIIKYFEKSKKTNLEQHEWENLEDALDHRFHLKKTLMYYTTVEQRREYSLHF